MKTTIELPDKLIQRAKIMAAQRHSTFKELVIAGLESVLRSNSTTSTVPLSVEEARYFDLDSEGFPVLKKGAAQVNNELINQMREELGV